MDLIIPALGISTRVGILIVGSTALGLPLPAGWLDVTQPADRHVIAHLAGTPALESAQAMLASPLN